MLVGMRPDSIAAGIRRGEAQHLEGRTQLLNRKTGFRDTAPRRASSPPSPRCEPAPQHSVRSREWLPFTCGILLLDFSQLNPASGAAASGSFRCDLVLSVPSVSPMGPSNAGTSSSAVTQMSRNVACLALTFGCRNAAKRTMQTATEAAL